MFSLLGHVTYCNSLSLLGSHTSNIFQEIESIGRSQLPAQRTAEANYKADLLGDSLEQSTEVLASR